MEFEKARLSSIDGNLTKFIKAINNGADDYYTYLELATLHGNINIVKYLLQNNYVSYTDAAIESIKNGKLNIYNYSYKLSENDNITYYTYMLKYNRYNFLRSFSIELNSLNNEDIKYVFKMAAQYGHVESFDELYKIIKNKLDDKLLIKYIIKNGRFELLKWFLENINDKHLIYSLELSIKYGYIGIMKWLIMQLGYNKDVINNAIEFASSNEINRTTAIKTLQKLLIINE